MEQEKIKELAKVVVDWFCKRIKEQYILEEIQQTTLDELHKLLTNFFYQELLNPERKGRLRIHPEDKEMRSAILGIYDLLEIPIEKIPVNYDFLIRVEYMEVYNKNHVIHKA